MNAALQLYNQLFQKPMLASELFNRSITTLLFKNLVFISGITNNYPWLSSYDNAEFG